MTRSIFRTLMMLMAWSCFGVGLTALADGETVRPASTASACLVKIGFIPIDGVEGRLDHLTWDGRSKRLFVASLENHTIEVIDLESRRRLRQIVGVNEPQGLLFIPERSLLLVCSRGDGTCRSFDGDTFLEGPWIDLGRNADNIRFDPDSKVLYVGSAGEPGEGLLSAIDLGSLLPVAKGGVAAAPRSPADFLLDRPRQADPRMDLQLPSHPESFQLDPVNHRILVNVPDEHEIAVVQVASNRLTKAAAWPVTVGQKNFPMAFDANSARLFIACRIPPRVAVYDTHNGAMLSQMPCVGDADDIFYDGKQRRLYVVGGEGYVDAFEIRADGRESAQLGHVPTAPRARTGLFLPDLNVLAVGAPRTPGNQAGIILFRCLQ